MLNVFNIANMYLFLIYIYNISFLNFLKIRTNVYLFKHFNFISSCNGLFNNFNYYKYLSSNASKHHKIMHKHFLKYASKPK